MSTRFVTDAGTEIPAVTADQMRELDLVAINGVGPTLQQMMENAGRTMAEFALDSIDGRKVIVLAGPGGNGGGGVCAARHLANWGVSVTVVVATDRPGPAARQQLGLFRETGGDLSGIDDLDALDPGVVIDALIGYGLSGPPRGAVSACIDWANRTEATVMALDVPSGLDATTGTAPGVVIRATRTLTLALPKTGLGAAEVGDLWLADLGIPSGVYRRANLEMGQVFENSHLVHLTAH